MNKNLEVVFQLPTNWCHPPFANKFRSFFHFSKIWVWLPFTLKLRSSFIYLKIEVVFNFPKKKVIFHFEEEKMRSSSILIFFWSSSKNLRSSFILPKTWVFLPFSKKLRLPTPLTLLDPHSLRNVAKISFPGRWDGLLD